jgi:hypothetical protein
MGDRRKCQTYTASPAEPGDLPVMLETEKVNCREGLGEEEEEEVR